MTHLNIRDLTGALEAFAPLSLQESYDNCGLQTGDPGDPVTGCLLCLDVTEAVLQEALDRGCNLVIAHHPVIFSGLKKLSGQSPVERIIRFALRNGIAIYAAHTNMDNRIDGVNGVIADRLGLSGRSILLPKEDTLLKLATYAPVESAPRVLDALFEAGAGHIGNYSECSFQSEGVGSFRPQAGTNPHIGQAGGGREAVAERRLEVVLPRDRQGAVVRALRQAHPYEEVAYDLLPVLNSHPGVGAGLVGTLERPLPAREFLMLLKEKLGTACIRHTADPGRPIHRVAVCGGSGSFLTGAARRAGADALVTGDFKYHQFFDADGQLLIADVGHYESEQHTPELFARILSGKFPNFAVLLSTISTNPVNYFY